MDNELWEHQDRANYDANSMREEFQERLYRKINMNCDSCRKKMSQGDTVNCETCWKSLEAFYLKAEKRIASLEAERERLRKCIVNFVDNCLRDEKECPYCREAAALVGGEVKNG